MSTVFTVLVSLLVVSITRSLPFLNQDGEGLRSASSMIAQYFCYKLRTCTPGPPKVCGHDSDEKELHEFEDLCTLYKTNCDNQKVFKLVDWIHCEEMADFYKNNGSRWLYQDTLSKFLKDKRERDRLLESLRSTEKPTTPGRYWSRDPNLFWGLRNATI